MLNLKPSPVVELLDGADEAEVALLDEVEERHAAAHVALGDGDHQAQVGLDQLRLAAMSPRSMRLASATSSAAVSSGTLPISRSTCARGRCWAS